MRTPFIALFIGLTGMALPVIADTQRPSTVNNINAESISTSAIRITWSQPQDNVGVDGYNVYRDGNYLETVRNRRYTDRGLAAGQTYRYAVVAFDVARNYSTMSAQDVATTLGGSSEPGVTPVSNSTPAPPDNLQADITSDSSAVLSWSTPSGGAEGYNVYRDGSYAGTVRGRNSYTASFLESSRSYSFEVVAFRNNRFSIHSDSIQVQTSGSSDPAQDAPTPLDDASEPDNTPANNANPAPPDNLQAEVTSSSSAILSWSRPAGGAEGYNIYRDGGYLATVIGRNNFTASSLDSARTYSFEVVAFRNNRFSIHSDSIQVRTSGSSNPVQETPAPPPPQASDSAVPEGYTLVFSDNFNQDNLNFNKWNTRYRWGPEWIINGESQYYIDIQNNSNFGATPFIHDGNNLTIRATRTPDRLRSSARNQPYLSGAMTTHGKFSMKYGYVEMRAKLPRGKGLWPALWLLHERDDLRRPEIDIVEMLGDNTRLVYQTYHFYDNGNLRSTPSFQATGSDFASDFHTFGMLWEPGSITWYVDGVATNRYTSSNVSDENMYLLVNTALGGGWAGLPDSSTSFPADFVIDYIRAYQR